MSIEKFTPSYDILKERIEKLKAVVPEAFEDGKVNFATLKETLGEFIEGDTEETEHYSFTWPGKRQARRLAAKPPQGALIPLKGEGANDDKTENIFIEGDNLEVLKILQKSYRGRVKMIYIDPPYNTGNDFIYNDNFTQPLEDYLKLTNQIDEEGSPLVANTRSDGRFHTKWLNMIYPRLLLARNLLTELGLIFISIDDNEVNNLKKTCDEIFGEENFVCQFVWKSKSGGANDSRHVAVDHEYILCYAKDANAAIITADKEAEVTTNYNLKDEKGEYALDRLDKQSLGYLQSLDFPITGPDGKVYKVEHKNPAQKVARWRWGKDTVKERYAELVFKDGYVYTKNYKKEGAIPRSLLIDERFGRTRTGKTYLADLMGMQIFDNPKPIQLIQFLTSITTSNNDIVLDFFAGSGTTANAVMAQNAKDNANRRFIAIQIPEPLTAEEKDQKAAADYCKKLGKPQTIAELTKERIRRAAKKIAKDSPKYKGDLGFKAFSLTRSHFKSWGDYVGTDINELMGLFSKQANTLNDNWQEENLLAETLQQEGFPLSSLKEKVATIADNCIWKVSSDFCEHSLYICLDKKVKTKTLTLLPFTPKDIFICLDNAITDEDKVKLADKGLIKTI